MLGAEAFGCADGLVCLSKGEKYCHNGGMAFARQSRGGGLVGVRGGAQGPRAAPLETACLQGKRLRGPGSTPLGAAMGSSA
jgi:hypothetical protein